MPGPTFSDTGSECIFSYLYSTPMKRVVSLGKISIFPGNVSKPTLT